MKLRGQCSPQRSAERTTREGRSILIAPIWMGAINDNMGNICELLITVVMWNEPKVLIGSDQKVRGMDSWLYIPATQSMIPPAERQALSCRVEGAELGKPNYLHQRVESDLQREPKDKWVRDVGKSKGQSVIGWIGGHLPA